MSFQKYPFPKDPNDILDYEIDWGLRLTQGDTIALSTFSIVSGSATVSRTGNTTSKTTFWLSGGAEGETVQILNRIQTTAGRQIDQTVGVKIKTA